MSSKTPKAKNAKTGSALNKNLLLLIGLFIVAGIGLVVFLFLYYSKAASPAKPALLYNDTTYCLGTQKLACPVRVELAKSEAQHIQGLSGRASLADDRGMLFQFDHIGTQCFWMKDMNFAIDILWLAADSSIIKIEHNLSPSTYPVSFCAESTYQVVELNSGIASELGLRLGDKITLPVVD